LGERWHAAGAAPMLQVPSAIVPLARSPDLNMVLSHSHPAAGGIRIAEIVDFSLDLRLL
jgi:hypothetical protein